jgi:sterol desaturase/sphingolipid hydroxylase (fatty acid hydroxylase superfamily)
MEARGVSVTPGRASSVPGAPAVAPAAGPLNVRAWVWPAFLVATAGAMVTGPAAGTPAQILLVASASVTVLLVLERLVPLRAEWSALGDSQVVHDVGHGLLQNELGARIGEYALALLAAGAVDFLGAPRGLGLWPHAWPLPAQVALAVFLADGLEYGRHRALHASPWLWRVHALHHSAARMHALKGGRLHCLDLLVRYLVVFAPLLALGAPADVIPWYAASLLVIGPISHANLALRFPPWLHRVLVTPPEHHLHHARDRALAASNLAPVFPFWDILFGTFRDPATLALGAVGIEDDPVPASFLGQLVSPFLSWRFPS